MSATRVPLVLLGLVAPLAFSACGGGGGGNAGSTTPPPAPVAPTPPDSEPDAFTIAAVADAPRGTAVASQAVTIQGINTPASISVAGGEYSVSGGAFTSAASTVANAQSIVVRVTASAAAGGVAEATLTVGSITARFTVTTSTDVTPPTATVVFPTARSRTSSPEVIVRGTASDSASPVTSVRVNGVEATSTDNFTTWTATVPLTTGANSIVVDAMDRALNRSPATPSADVTRNALLGFAEGIAVDAAQGRVIASDGFAGFMYSIDLATGLRTAIPNNSTLQTQTSDRLVIPSSVALEANGTHALVLDRSGPAAILRVNLATGARTLVSGRGFPNNQNELGNNALAMSVDFTRNSAYVLGRAPDAIYRVDLTAGARTILSDANTGAGPMFPNPMTIGLDSARGRLLVGDQGTNGGHALYTVDVVNGARTILSSDAVPNPNNRFSFIGGIAVDGNRALVLQPFTASIFAVELVTNPFVDSGNRTVYSSPVFPSATNPFEQPRAIATTNTHAYVADAGTRSLLRVDLPTGTREAVVSANEPADIGERQRYSTGIALDLSANRAYVTDPLSQTLLAVNLATGTRTLVSSRTQPPGPEWWFPNAVAVDAPRNRLLVADLGGPGAPPAIYAVNMSTGERSVLSGLSQLGPVFVSPNTLAIDRTNDRALVAEGALNAVVAVNLVDGSRTVLSGPAVPPGPVELTMPYGIVVDAAGDRALVTHVGPPSVAAVRLDNGARSLLSSAGTTGTWLPMGIGIDEATRTIVTGDVAINAVHVIDPVSGHRTVASSATSPRTNDHLKPRGVAVDGARRIAWVTNDDFAILQIVDLVTGERVFLTR